MGALPQQDQHRSSWSSVSLLKSFHLILTANGHSLGVGITRRRGWSNLAVMTLCELGMRETAWVGALGPHTLLRAVGRGAAAAGVPRFKPL